MTAHEDPWQGPVEATEAGAEVVPGRRGRRHTTRGDGRHAGPDAGMMAEKRRGRHGERGGPRVGRGDVRTAALLLLTEQPLHGYQIIRQIDERSGGLWRPSAGSVYPALQLLEDEGFVRAQQEEGRRVFHLTDPGRVHVEDHRDELTAARDAVTGRMDSGSADLRTLYKQVGAALKQVGQAGTPAQVAAAAVLLANARRGLYHILADETLSGDAR